MTSRVRIDLTAGTVEAEGSEEFVRAIYNDFRERVAAKAPRLEPPGEAATASAARTESGATSKKAAAPRRKSGATTRRAPVLDKGLDLAAKGSRPALKEFVKRYRKLTSAMEHNALFVYYLAREAEVSPITMDQIYTCYRHVGVRLPTLLDQSLWDTARIKGTIDASSLDDVTLTTTGANWVEHDLEKAKAEAD